MRRVRRSIVGVAALFATNAFATMPPLTDMPNGKSVAVCLQWAKEQDEDSLYMWGTQDSGANSQAVAIDRLARYCIDGSQPEIVGFGSSAGFDEAYCRKHSRSAICRDRR